MRKLYQFSWDSWYGNITGTFVADESEVERAIGAHIEFGPVLGKYSDIYGELGPNDVQVVTDDQDFIDKALAYGLVPIGYNPLYCLSEEDEDDQDDS